MRLQDFLLSSWALKCLSKQGFCDETCGCVDCFNNTEHKTERDLVLRKTEQILGKSFGQKFKLNKSSDKVNTDVVTAKLGASPNYALVGEMELAVL